MFHDHLTDSTFRTCVLPRSAHPGNGFGSDGPGPRTTRPARREKLIMSLTAEHARLPGPLGLITWWDSRARQPGPRPDLDHPVQATPRPGSCVGNHHRPRPLSKAPDAGRHCPHDKPMDVVTSLRDLAETIDSRLQLGSFHGEQRLTMRRGGEDLVLG